MATKRMTAGQTREMRGLEGKLRQSLVEKDFDKAKRVVARATSILRGVGQETRSLKYKNRYFEAVMNAGDLEKAISAFEGIRRRAPRTTRVRLEATTLLAIAYLRSNRPTEAKPLIFEVMRDDKVIQSEERRKEFRARAYERFDEEIVLAACRGVGRDSLNVGRIASEADKLSRQSDTELIKYLAAATPGEAILALRNIDSFTLAQLPQRERKLLTVGQPTDNEQFAADTLFKAFKRILYPSFCDPTNDFYKNFFNRPLTAAMTSGSVAAAVGKYMQSANIGLYGLAVGVTAMIVKLGVATLCERYRPKDVLVDFR